jgi:signal transduction histidine kinase
MLLPHAILVVARDPDPVLRSLGPLAEQHPVESVEALAEALVRVQGARCSVAILDGHGFAGVEAVCEQLARLDVPVIALVDDLAEAGRLTRAQAAAVLPRGRRVAGLEAVARRLIAGHDAVDAREQRVRDLERASQMLRGQVRTMLDFQSRQEHEVRTPLGIIRNFAHNLRDGLDGPLNDEQQQSVDAIVRAAEQLVSVVATQTNSAPNLPAITDDLLAGGGAGQRRSRRSQEDLGAVTASVAELFEDDARRSRLTLTCTVEPDLPKLWLDRARITQVLTNLLANAIKFTPAGGEVAVTVRSEAPAALGPALRRFGSELRLTVTNTGPGIPEDELETIFERNRRGRGALQSGTPGSGIGLSVARELVQAHGGRIWASNPDGGLAFHVVLPVDLRTRRVGRNIAVLPDEEAMLELIGGLDALRPGGLTVSEGTAEEALTGLLGAKWP